MDEQKKCPVCGTEILADEDTCPICGMNDLNQIFLDKESYDHWVETKLKSYINQYNKAVVTVAAGYCVHRSWSARYSGTEKRWNSDCDWIEFPR